MPTYPSNAVFSAFSFVGFILALIPFSWHCRASSIGTCLFVTWTGLLCLVFFANSIIWNDNVIDWAPVWCDISSRFIVAMNAGFPVACLLIKRRLYNIARMSPVTNKSRELALELGLGLGLPVLEVGLYSTVEGHRFDIYEEAGCWPTMVILPWAYPLVICVPLIIGLINLLYGTLTIYRVVKERRALQELLPTTHKICDHPIDSHFIRLLTLSSVEVIFTIPLACLEIYIDSRNGLYTWRGWADLRYKFSRSFLYPSVIWRADGYRLAGVELNRWSPVLCAFVFFSLFGFADEARRNYKAAWRVLKRPIIWIAPEWMRR
ncbi:fungal pheromone STE3G-protein-coupled receptor [Stereum hirsutum FP-91666 SS1]|uniref:fungal pheromone STE3G-protein-coupled receptor n=1 Tax=Stereum hirsutum (strain FP-91666) TaxID=721885 RepID=UPI000444A48D|nr:fungal pheromone STE3G-protein-coupled receptor [Stereum hirsutum FP-91666 SS1]EIM84442.1 fungal pheromone STE3G-protein-coupled receptor [Stereum hirsutum FP-91666 SS1]